MEKHRKTSAEGPDRLFEQLQAARALLPDYRQAYWALNRTFLMCLNQNTNFAGVRFGGAFAKTDYLLKEHHAPRLLRQTVNDARVRLRRLRELSDSQLADNFAHDLKAICQLVALIGKVPVPAVLEAAFPADRAPGKGELRGECLRVVVNRWDDTYIYAYADEAAADEVKIQYGAPSDFFIYKDWDWSYLKQLLAEGCQLNLVRPRADGGVLYPELIIWEPDYLIDISAIAACFEPYATTHLNHLFNKLKPAPSSAAIVLGNLASQFLDEELCSDTANTPYGQRVQKFFKGNAMSLLTAPLPHDFHTQARQQQLNIRNTIRQKLPAVLGNDHISFDSSEVMVEPSFFSEMLGLQGRMDFLQLDHKVLIEQKAGKGAFPETDPPHEQEKHYVQLLLYMLLIRYNFRDNYEQNSRELHAFLLYSKYQNGLLNLGFAPRLVFRAIRIRNEIAAAEFDYTRNGLQLLTTLNADMLNANKTTGALWNRYQKPQIETLLGPIRNATELERAYYLRFLRFVETEHLMAKVGSQTKENSGFADKWHSSLEDKLLAGNIYCGLHLLSPAATDSGKVEQVVLAFTEKPDHDISNFRPGDIVILYPYPSTDGQEPDARRTMVFRATIETIGNGTIALNLRATQADARVFWHHGQRLWAIEHDFFESSFGALYRGMQAFLSAPRERRELLLLQRAPQCDKTITLTGNYGAFNKLSLKAKQARDLFLIIGPPGTGKTSFGLLNTLKEQLLDPSASVLLLSYTNRAVDEICSKLCENAIDFIRMGSKFSCEDRFRPYLLESRVQQSASLQQLQALVGQTRVFVGTTTAFNSNVAVFRLKQFSLAIIDEASQILEPHLMGLLAATAPDGTSAIRKLILIGDHKQLPAVVQQNEAESAVSDPQLRAIHLTNCRLSLFERLLRQYRDNPDVVYMLTRQGRMHHDIARFPNEAFYQNRLQEVPLGHQCEPLPAKAAGHNAIARLIATRRVAFVAVEPPARSVSDKVNQHEAQAIAATVVQIYEQTRDAFSPHQTVGVIVPYRNQIAEIRSWIAKSGIEPLAGITIDTVERYQGSQRDYIIYGFTVGHRYQLSFLADNVFEEDGCLIDRKLNVAMTRARKHLLLFGYARLLAENATFARLLAFLRQHNSYVEVPLARFLEGNFRCPTDNIGAPESNIGESEKIL